MFRVPAHPLYPTFDETSKVSFWRWLRSKRWERLEWRRRRDIAARVARDNQIARIRRVDTHGKNHGE